MAKIGYLGPKGTFTKLAVHAMFPEEEMVAYPTIPACIDAAKDGLVDFTVVPLENTIEGSVNLTLDYLIHEHRMPIVGEIVLPIQQHLMVHPNHSGNLKDIEEVYSHSHAIAQCHRFIHQQLSHVSIEFTKSTGAAAELVMNNPNKAISAIGNELAAVEYGLKIIAKNTHDYANNHTRFVILHQQDRPVILKEGELKGEKTTLLITLPSDYAGALHTVLSAFSWRKLNLSKIESRPMKTGLGNYYFIIDVEQAYDEVLLPGVKAELEALGCDVKILGSYPCYLVDKVQLSVK